MNELLTQLYGYLYGMWRYRRSALAVAWLVALIGWLGVFAIPDKYSVNAVVYADTSSIMKPLLKGLTPETDAYNELSIMNRILLSRENLLSVIRETDMDLSVHTPLEREQLVISLGKAIYVKSKNTRGNSKIYEIGYTSVSAERGYQVVSNLLNTMIEDTLNSTRTDTDAAQKFIDEQIAGYEKRLSISEQKLAEFKKANLGYMPDEKGNYYTRLQGAKDKVEKTRSDLNLAIQRLVELKKQLRGESSLLDNASYQPAFIKKLQLYENQLAELLNQYTENYPDVLALKTKIEKLKANQNSGQYVSQSEDETPTEFNPVYQEIKVQSSKAGVEIQILKAQLAEEQKQVRKLKGSIDIIPEVEARLVKLNRDYEITKKRYLGLVDRREAASLAQDVGQSTSDVTFRVIEPPIVPTRPSDPKRSLLLLAVLILAIAAGLGWSYMRFMLQPTFFGLHQLSEKTGVPVLGAISLYLSPQHKKQRQIQLASFFMVAVLLAFACLGTLMFKHEGTELGKTLIAMLEK